MDVATHTANLARMNQELTAYGTANELSAPPAKNDEAHRISQGMFLAHSTPAHALAAICRANRNTAGERVMRRLAADLLTGPAFDCMVSRFVSLTLGPVRPPIAPPFTAGRPMRDVARLHPNALPLLQPA